VRPIRLKIEGLRSFRACSPPIDFTGRDYIAVIGDTGAGKSSILEAITFALYGRTTFSGQGHQELMNASSNALRVVFAFDVRGDHWEVIRTLRRAGTGKVFTGVTSLRRFDDRGKPLESFEKARDVTAKVESILGLDDEAFLRTVVLPQGQFSRLLVDDDPKLRASVLRQIWRTDELTEAGTLASDALAELGPLRGRVEQALEGEPDDAAAHLAGLEAEAGRCSARLDAARKREREASDAAKAVVDAAAQVVRMDQLVSLLSKWDGPATVAVAREIEAAERRFGNDLAEAQQLLDAARVALDAVPSDDDGYTLTEIATFAALLESLPGDAARLDEAASEVARTQRELAALEERLAGATNAAAKASEQLDALEAGRIDLAANAAVAEAKLGPAEAAVKEARRAAAATVDAELRFQASETAVSERAKELEAVRAAQSQASSAQVAATGAFEGERRAVAAADAGHGLHGGDPCPVCDRELPLTWKPLAAPELEAARHTRDEAAKHLEAAQAAVMLQEGLFQAAETSVEGRRQELVDARNLATAASSALGDQLGAAPELDRPDAELLADS
jgi:exonuclease SbcC